MGNAAFFERMLGAVIRGEERASLLKVRDSGLARGECCAMRSAMKTFPLISAVAVLFLSACDRHQWEGEDGVKELYKHGDESHGAGHGEHEKGHGDEHAGHAEGDAHKKEEEAH